MKPEKSHRDGTFTGRLRAGQKELLSLFASAVLLSLGVGLVSSAIVQSQSGNELFWLIWGILVSLISGLFLVKLFLPAMRFQKKITGVLVIERKTTNLVKVREYSFSHDLSAYLQALKNERPAIYKRWETTDFYTFTNGKREEMTSAPLLRQATEYFVLTKLSGHLKDYFNKEDIDTSRLITLTRNQIPTVLLSNCFLETFSRDMGEREAFSAPEAQRVGVSDGSKVVYSITSSGAIFDDFDLTLPRGSTIERNPNGSVSIKNSVLELTISIDFGGFSYNLPSQFEQLYLAKKVHDVHAKQISVSIDVSFSRLAAFSSAAWEYHGWVDSFLESFDQKFNFDRFSANLNWGSVLANHYAWVNLLLAQNERRTRADDDIKKTEMPGIH